MITKLECSIFGTDLTIDLTPGSLLATLHQASTVTERATCFYGLEPALDALATVGGMRVAGRDALGEVRAVERLDHPFFLATLYQPQLRSTATVPHPVFTALLIAAGKEAAGRA